MHLEIHIQQKLERYWLWFNNKRYPEVHNVPPLSL